MFSKSIVLSNILAIASSYLTYPQYYLILNPKYSDIILYQLILKALYCQYLSVIPKVSIVCLLSSVNSLTIHKITKETHSEALRNAPDGSNTNTEALGNASEESSTNSEALSTASEGLKVATEALKVATEALKVATEALKVATEEYFYIT